MPILRLTGCLLAAGLVVSACSPREKAAASTPVSKADFETQGRGWPLSVPEGAVGCSHGNELWFQTKGKRYGLNEQASKARGYVALDSIWVAEAVANGASPNPGNSALEFLTASGLASGSALLTELARSEC